MKTLVYKITNRSFDILYISNKGKVWSDVPDPDSGPKRDYGVLILGSPETFIVSPFASIINRKEIFSLSDAPFFVLEAAITNPIKTAIVPLDSYFPIIFIFYIIEIKRVAS